MNRGWTSRHEKASAATDEVAFEGNPKHLIRPSVPPSNARRYGAPVSLRLGPLSKHKKAAAAASAPSRTFHRVFVQVSVGFVLMPGAKGVYNEGTIENETGGS